MTTMTYSNLPMGATFTVSNSNEVFAKHSESLALCADGTKIRVTQPTRALVNQIDIRDVKPAEPTYVDEIHAKAAEKIGGKVRRELRAHLRKRLPWMLEEFRPDAVMIQQDPWNIPDALRGSRHQDHGRVGRGGGARGPHRARRQKRLTSERGSGAGRSLDSARTAVPKPPLTDVERQTVHGELSALPLDFACARSAVELRKIVRRLRLVADTIEEATKRDA